MNITLLQKLKEWRQVAAQKEGVELYRVLSNEAVEAIALLKPKTEEELISIKGIKEKKFMKYGTDILSLVSGGSEKGLVSVEKNVEEDNKPYTVSHYLNYLNFNLKKHKARIQGEISSLNIGDNVVYFALKDSEDGSVISCLIWKSDYELNGIDFEIGMEVVLGGLPDIYKPLGRLSFKTLSVELVGEGVLKKAYDKLKKMLEKEGLFDIEAKKEIPEFSEKIGLITSETGAVINDFLSNLGKHGYDIKFMNSRVEGKIAVRNLMLSLDYFKDKDIDVLVIIRGGGSLESLQAFNNEALVRKIAEFKIPVICGIGHDKDVSLVSLAADKAVSTPTAVTSILDESWDKALSRASLFEKDIFYKYQSTLSSIDRFDSIKIDILQRYQNVLMRTVDYMETSSVKLNKQFDLIFKKFEKLRYSVKESLTGIGYKIKETMKSIDVYADTLSNNIKIWLEMTDSTLDNREKELKIFNPTRQLKLGYSIVSFRGKILKSIKQIKIGEEIDIQIFDGKIKSKIEDIIN